jgi:L-2-hydroxycarboxylate dehydrogenase (NAD+)
MTINTSVRDELHRKVETGICVAVDDLMLMVRNIFEALGLPSNDANCAAQTVIYADVRGIDSHGVSTILPGYINGYLKKSLNPHPNIIVNRVMKTAAYLDADNASGVVVMKKAVDVAIEIADEYGIGIVAVRNAGHAGALGYHALHAVKKDMIGMVMAAGKGLMVPPFGREPLLGTNPIALAVPTKKMPPFVFDAATTAVCGNKIRLAEILDVAIPTGWINDESQQPNKVGSRYFEDLLPSLLPLGSTYDLGAHKGFGFGMMAEIFCNTLSSSLSFTEMNPTAIGHFVAVFRIDIFGSCEAFKSRMDTLLQAVVDAPSAEGFSQVMYAGLRAHEKELYRQKNGIPLQPSVLRWFHDTAARLNIECNLPTPIFRSSETI